MGGKSGRAGGDVCSLDVEAISVDRESRVERRASVKTSGGSEGENVSSSTVTCRGADGGQRREEGGLSRRLRQQSGFLLRETGSRQNVLSRETA